MCRFWGLSRVFGSLISISPRASLIKINFPPSFAARSGGYTERMTTLEAEFLAILRCPLSLAELVQDGESLVSKDAETRRRYPITDGFPVLLIEEAEELSETDWGEVMNRCCSGDKAEA